MPLNQLQLVDLKLLRVFQTVAKSGGLSAAQDELNISTSTISIHISNLEGRLGMTLCHRGRGGFALTEEGKNVLDAGDALFAHIEDFGAKIADISGERSGELNLGILDNSITNPGFSLANAIREFKHQHRHVRINVHVVAPDLLTDMILDGRLHVAVGYFPRKVVNLRYEALTKTRMELFCGRNHPLFKAAKTALSDAVIAAAEHAQRGYVTMAQMPRLHREFNFTARSYNIEGLAHLVLSGGYLAFLPRHYAEKWVKSGELRSLRPSRYAYNSSYHLAWRKAELIMPTTRQFLKIARAMAT